VGATRCRPGTLNLGYAGPGLTRAGESLGGSDAHE